MNPNQQIKDIEKRIDLLYERLVRLEKSINEVVEQIKYAADMFSKSKR